MFQPLLKKSHWILIVASALLAATACSPKMFVVESRAPLDQVVVDGKSEEWKNALYLIDEAQLFVGFMNDRNNLYVCLISGDRRASARLVRQGLTVWFDPAGGKEKVLGIKYPVGAPPEDFPQPMMRGRPDETGEDVPFDPPTELDVLRQDQKSPERMALDQAEKEGLEVRVNFSRSAFVYELKIPLVPSENEPLAVGAQPHAVVGIGFESSQMNMNRMQGRPQGGRGGGGRPPMGGRMGGMGGGRGGFGGKPQMPKPIKFWAQVRLIPDETAGKSLLLDIVFEPRKEIHE